MRRITSCCIALVLAGCGGAADKAETNVGEGPAMEEAPAGVSLADMAGTWNVRGRMEGSDSTVVTYDLAIAPDGSGSLTFPGREPIPVRLVAVDGDSVVTEAGPFESALRKGVQVSTHVVSRMQDGKLVGTTVARYQTTGPDSVARLTFEGTRAP